MIVEQINEENFRERKKEGEAELQKKFDSWNRLIKNKNNMKLDEFKARTAYLWRDPTIWAYACLKDDQGKPLKLYVWQDIVINERGRFVHVHAANQIGKSLIIVNGWYEDVNFLLRVSLETWIIEQRCRLKYEKEL